MRITCSVWGAPKTGKTHFSLTFPGRVMFVEIMENGSEIVLPKFSDKQIEHHLLTINALEPVPADYEKMLKEFETYLNKATDPKTDYSTLVIDSASMLWKVVREVLVEKMQVRAGHKTTKQTDYQLANFYYEQIVRKVDAKPSLNLVLCNRARETWEKYEDEHGNERARPSGRLEGRDFKETEYLVQAVLRTTTGMVGKRMEFFGDVQVSAWKWLEGRQLVRPSYDSLVRLIQAGPGAVDD